MKHEDLLKQSIEYILEVKALGQQIVSSTEIAIHFEISQEQARDLLREMIENETFPDADISSEGGIAHHEIRFR